MLLLLLLLLLLLFLFINVVIAFGRAPVKSDAGLLLGAGVGAFAVEAPIITISYYY